MQKFNLFYTLKQGGLAKACFYSTVPRGSGDTSLYVNPLFDIFLEVKIHKTMWLMFELFLP